MKTVTLRKVTEGNRSLSNYQESSRKVKRAMRRVMMRRHLRVTGNLRLTLFPRKEIPRGQADSARDLHSSKSLRVKKIILTTFCRNLNKLR